jgi:hypothetical protein
MKLEFYRQILEKCSDIKFRETLFGGGAEFFHAYGRTDVTKVIVTLWNSTNAAKNQSASSAQIRIRCCCEIHAKHTKPVCAECGIFGVLELGVLAVTARLWNVNTGNVFTAGSYKWVFQLNALVRIYQLALACCWPVCLSFNRVMLAFASSFTIHVGTNITSFGADYVMRNAPACSSSCVLPCQHFHQRFCFPAPSICIIPRVTFMAQRTKGEIMLMAQESRVFWMF